MLILSVGSSLEWGWIEFVGLWLLSPLVLVFGSISLLHYWLGRRHK